MSPGEFAEPDLRFTPPAYSGWSGSRPDKPQFLLVALDRKTLSQCCNRVRTCDFVSCPPEASPGLSVDQLEQVNFPVVKRRSERRFTGFGGENATCAQRAIFHGHGRFGGCRCVVCSIRCGGVYAGRSGCDPGVGRHHRRHRRRRRQRRDRPRCRAAASRPPSTSTNTPPPAVSPA